MASLLRACAAATFTDGTRFHPINATQVGLLWRVARKSIFLKNGGVEADSVDVEPWDNPSQTPPAVPADGPMDLRSYQESRNTSSKWIKIASLLDQSDESELVPAAPDKVQEWSQRYITTMGAPPEEEEEEEEEATGSQLAALCNAL